MHNKFKLFHEIHLMDRDGLRSCPTPVIAAYIVDKMGNRKGEAILVRKKPSDDVTEKVYNALVCALEYSMTQHAEWISGLLLHGISVKVTQPPDRMKNV